MKAAVRADGGDGAALPHGATPAPADRPAATAARAPGVAAPLQAQGTTPSLARRMACFAYEALILFGVGLVPGAIGAFFVRVLGPEGAWHAEGLLRAIAFAVYGAYFTWCWSRSGQTLPMQTWRIRVVTAQGGALTQRRAFARYLLACAWVAPGWLAGTLLGLRGWAMLGCVAVSIVLYALLALARRDRQFWHDAACGTRLVNWQARLAGAAAPLAATSR